MSVPPNPRLAETVGVKAGTIPLASMPTAPMLGQTLWRGNRGHRSAPGGKHRESAFTRRRKFARLSSPCSSPAYRRILSNPRSSSCHCTEDAVKITQIALSSVLLLFPFPGWPSLLRAEGFSLQDLNPFSSRNDAPEMDHGRSHSLVDVSHRTGGQGPSLWDRVSADLRRLNNGTKRFLANTADALCWRKKSPPPPPSRTSTHKWRTPSTSKNSNSRWFTPFWTREEPPLPKSPQDFVGMERPRM